MNNVYKDNINTKSTYSNANLQKNFANNSKFEKEMKRL